MDRLQGLVFSFYREDLSIKKVLRPLLSCKMIRLMGVIYIECRNSRHLEEVLTIIKYLNLPIGLLKLGRKIIIHSIDAPDLNYSIPIELDRNLYV